MEDKPMWMQIMELEMFLGNSDRCVMCGHEFLANSDKGCPRCGHWRTTKLRQEEEVEDWDMETFPVHVCSTDLPNIIGFVKIGDFSPWPRV